MRRQHSGLPRCSKPSVATFSRRVKNDKALRKGWLKGNTAPAEVAPRTDYVTFNASSRGCGTAIITVEGKSEYVSESRPVEAESWGSCAGAGPAKARIFFGRGRSGFLGKY